MDRIIEGLEEIKSQWSVARGVPFANVFCKDSLYVNNGHLKSFLVKYYFDYRCSGCNIFKWNDEPLVLQLDHINGVRNDNRLENLRLLCPNCHSQTPTFCRGGSHDKGKSGMKVSSKNLIESLRTSDSIRQALIKVGLQPFGGNYNRAIKLSKDNDIVLRSKPKNFKRPEVEELLGVIGQVQSIILASEAYKVSVRSVRSWLAFYGLPSAMKDLRSYLSCSEKVKNYSTGRNRATRKELPINREDLLVLLSRRSIRSIGKTFSVSDNAIRKWMKRYDIPTKKKDLSLFLRETGYGYNISIDNKNNLPV